MDQGQADCHIAWVSGVTGLMGESWPIDFVLKLISVSLPPFFSPMHIRAKGNRQGCRVSQYLANFQAPKVFLPAVSRHLISNGEIADEMVGDNVDGRC